MERKNYIVAVDLGSSSVRVAVGEKTDGGLMEIACVVSKPVEGVRAGKIENIELVSQAVCEAFGEVEEQLGIHITEAYAGISGDFVRCARHTDHVFVYDPQNGVNQKDVDALFDRMRNVQAPDDETIMERVPQNYAVDDDREVRNPVGSFGKKLSSTFNFILCQRTPMQRLEMALKRLGIRTLGIIPDALATPESVLLPDEKEEGIAVVDVGAGVTDVTVYYRNVVRYVVSIPMGASAINRDIRTLSVPEKHVESLKRKYGSAVAELASDEKLIRVNGRTAREAKDILLRNLATVIEARATDIAEFVLQEIRDSGYADKLAYGIVLTGGSAALKDLDELFRRVTKMDVRVALPETGITEASKERVADPACATVVGLLLRGAAQGGCAFIETHVPTPSPAPSPRPTPTPAPSPRPMPTPTPAPAPAPSPASDPEEPEIEESESTAPRRKRDWGSILQKTFDKINKSFSAAEDEEI
ncbi:cell division protein FtsA [uncultured Alistipes sp.]|uniref:cell division protein FtsA n=1 Tax=uncultured Alistipes sp. TaxID=538949 RepID=UPI001F972745|nr:cell division protein FtsA [uncultured Alistipes sp.]HJC27296.1 cell division protein FtsA [Candidatus Alistipes stercoravium]